MKIVVLTKQVPDTNSDRKLNLTTGLTERDASDPVPDEINERALESALKYRDAGGDVEVIVLTIGNDVTKSARKLLSMGADSAVIVEDGSLAGADMVQTAKVLAAALRRIGFDLVLAGNESTDGRGGVVPAMLAELLGLPLLPSLDEIQIAVDAVSGEVQVDGGSLSLRSPLPAVASVTERSAEARFPNFKGIMQAKKKPVTTLSLADLGIVAGPEAPGARSVMVSALERPAKQAGPKIVDDGTAADKLADFLASNRLL
ncbi:electron transfer flavoprotein subunit beta/FixA family protein [Arthrobacter sp. 18067]|uniref:electron transfer flavoprotein subunit beta/FixA family protein n=1 Tax=Arthrobacter sp. 18067 TaxID=2681413 RepID=UPI001357E243|nr:electron transfer flavoprotein subunit beta/FixA family protein [Arthrobacter sp. 18067]